MFGREREGRKGRREDKVRSVGFCCLADLGGAASHFTLRKETLKCRGKERSILIDMGRVVTERNMAIAMGRKDKNDKI